MNDGNDIDWVQLWMLNEAAISKTLPLTHFLDDPVQKAWLSPWNFPGREVLRSNRDRRKKALIHCIQSGWLKAYALSSQGNLHYSHFDSPQLDNSWLDDSSLLPDFIAVLTWVGHRKWVDDFQPKWSRFWTATSGTAFEGGQNVTITYASNEVLEDLIEWFPAYMGFGKDTPAKVSDPTTVYCFQATVWQVLDRVKTATFAIPIADPAWQVLNVKVDEGAPDSTAQTSRRVEFETTSKALSLEQREAHHVLRTLSACWASASTSDVDRRDAIPKKC